MHKRASLRWYGLAGAVVCLDQASKAWVLARFHDGETLTLTPFFNLVLVMNPGASFSLLADAGGWQRWFFSALAIGVSLWLGLLIRRHAEERLQPAAFALILGGAVGNLIDRLRFGAVVDFFDFHYAGWHWPAFNMADAAITLGVALLFLHAFLNARRGPSS
ncbi:MAG: signal peptidase II [Rhodocyclaceae bacterium]|nr:signal peptidase II [Rhodocyclaceae bacterium]